MQFEEKIIRRSIREFGDLAQNILNSNSQLYQVRIEKFVAFIQEDQVMKVIIKPFLEIEIQYDDYITTNRGGWTEISLPQSKDGEIAFTLGLFFKSANGEFEMAEWGFRVFNKTGSSEEAIFDLNSQLIKPVFQELSHRLNDLVADKVEGNEEIDSQSLTIINVGNITAKDSNIAVGNANEQSIEIGLKEEIFKKFLDQGLKLEEIQSISSEIEKFVSEAKKEKPDESMLRKFFKPIYEVGKQISINVFSELFTKPQVLSAISGYISNS